MKIPMLSGIVADATAEFLQTYPVNLEPVALENGIDKGQLRATAGAITLVAGPGIDRGGAYWNDMLYRVMGTRLVRLRRNMTIDDLGDVGGTGPCSFAIGPDRLAIRSGTSLYYWNDIALTQMTDPDLGPCLDVTWIDGYFMSTDGSYVVVTELNNALEVKPLKYGAAEEDPDPITGLLKFRDEVYVLGLHTIQVFRDTGGAGFPFQTLPGATIPAGCVGAMAKCIFGSTFAFVGGGRNEGLGVCLAGAGTYTRISTRAVDDELRKVEDPSGIVLEHRLARGEDRLYVHLPNKTLVFLSNASAAVKEALWYVAQSGHDKPYRVRSAIRAYGKAIVGDTEQPQLGELVETVCTHFGELAEWRFDLGLLYNEGKGAVLHSVELIGLPGRLADGAPDDDSAMWLSLTRDGQQFTTERPISMGARGDHGHRMQWRPRTNFRNYLGLRVRGYSSTMPGFSACEVTASPLAA